MSLFIPIVVFLCGLLTSSGHPFRWNDFFYESSWLSIATASIGLLVAIPFLLKESPKKRFVLGWVFGTGYFLGVLFWIAYAVQTFGGIHPGVSLLILFSLVCYCGLYWAIWSLICGHESIKQLPLFRKILVWASAFTFLEVCRQFFLTGFPWGELGHAFYFSSFVSAAASIFGAHGLTFFWIATIAVILHLLHSDTRLLAIKSGLLLLVILIASSGTGRYILSKFDKAHNRTVFNIGVVQPNIAQDIKWDPHQAQSHLERLILLSKNLESQKPDLLIWPETSYPYLISSEQKQIKLDLNTPVLLGAVTLEGDTNHNSALLVTDNQISQSFHKMHLVPFGEYVPLQDWIPFGKLVANVGNFEPGSDDQSLMSFKNIQIGPLICYEDIFNRSSVWRSQKGAHLLLNLTNDAWYGKTSALAQHAALAQFQTLQTGLPMIRGTNNGLSTLITPTSRIDLPLFSEESRIFELSLPVTPIQTPFSWSYPLMEWIWLAIFAIAALWKSPRSKRKIFFQKSPPF